MKCTSCSYHFCWVCMGAWDDHGPQTGGFYNCNMYVEKKASKVFIDEQSKRFQASRDIRRYEFYFGKFMSHEQSQRKAHNTIAEVVFKMTDMINNFDFKQHEVEFLRDACNSVISSR